MYYITFTITNTQISYNEQKAKNSLHFSLTFISYELVELSLIPNASSSAGPTFKFNLTTLLLIASS